MSTSRTLGFHRSRAFSFALLLLSSLTPPTLHAQSAYFAGPVTPLGGGFSNPLGVAVDSGGNVYVTDSGNAAVKEIPPGCTSSACVTTLGGGFTSLWGVAVDLNGNIYVTDVNGQGDSWVKEMPPGCASSSCVTTVGGDFAYPEGLAVDELGNVYVADYKNTAVKTMPPGCTSSGCVTTLGGGFHAVTGVAVDRDGNIYVADPFNNSAVKKMSQSCTAANYANHLCTITTLGGGFDIPYGVAADGGGKVYVADSSDNTVKRILPGCTSSSCVSGLGAGFNMPRAVAVDKNGNVYVADTGNNAVEKIISRAVNFGAVAVGATSPAITFYVNFIAGDSGITTSAVTQGATGLDFTDAGTGTCDINGTSHTYNAGDTCTVNIIFAPTLAGARYGAVNLFDATGVIATAYIYGTGQAPQLVFPGNPAVQLVGGGFDYPSGLAVDARGDIYVADAGDGLVKEVPPGCVSSSCVTTLGGGFDYPHDVVVDGGGNVYVLDDENGKLMEMPPGCASSSCVTLLNSDFSHPSGMAVDSNGTVYVIDYGNFEVKVVPPGCTSSFCITTVENVSGLGMAVDQSGNIYLAGLYPSNTIREIPAGCLASTCVVNLGGGFDYTTSVAVDGAGNIYVTDAGTVKVMPPGCTSSTCVTTLGAGGFNEPEGLAVDARGNVYVADYGNDAVEEMPLATPPSLTFANTAVGYQSIDSPKTVTLKNIGNAPLTFLTPAAGENPSVSANFTLDASTTCPVLAMSSPPGTLAPQATCELALDLVPITAGLITGSVMVTDDNLNSTSATQTIPLSSGFYSVWIVDGTGGASELNDNGGDVTTTADPGQNIALAVDSFGNTWTIGSGTPPLEETSDRGSLLNQIAANTGGLISPAAIAIDGASQVWIANGNNSISLFADSGAPLSPYYGFTDPSLSTPAGIAIDLAGSVWIANHGNNSMTRILGAAAPVAPIATAVANNTTGAKP